MKNLRKKKTAGKSPDNIRRTIYIPSEVDDFISKKSKLEGRSISNYVAQVFREKMNEKNI